MINLFIAESNEGRFIVAETTVTQNELIAAYGLSIFRVYAMSDFLGSEPFIGIPLTMGHLEMILSDFDSVTIKK